MHYREKYPFAVYATAFHGGRFISRHATRTAAERAASKFAREGCTCGCAGIIDESKGEKPGTQAEQDKFNDPYAIGSI